MVSEPENYLVVQDISFFKILTGLSGLRSALKNRCVKIDQGILVSPLPTLTHKQKFVLPSLTKHIMLTYPIKLLILCNVLLIFNL